MTVLPQRMPHRVLTALVLAAVLVTGLQLGATAWADARPQRGRKPAFGPSALVGLPLRLVPASGVVLLARTQQALAPDVRPVLALAADGELAVRRPVADEDPAALPGDVGLVLPDTPLPAWTPAARATLVALLGAWVAERPVAGDRVRAVDGVLTTAELAMLLGWVP